MESIRAPQAAARLMLIFISNACQHDNEIIIPLQIPTKMTIFVP